MKTGVKFSQNAALFYRAALLACATLVFFTAVPVKKAQAAAYPCPRPPLAHLNSLYPPHPYYYNPSGTPGGGLANTADYLSINFPAHMGCPSQKDDLQKALDENWIPVFRPFADQLSASMLHQIFGIGALLDAKHQLETQRLLGQLRAEAHKNYAGSDQLCRYGTNVRSLAASEELGRSNKQIFSQMLQQRLTLRGNSGSERGRFFDQRNRYDQFRRMYCNPEENDEQFWNQNFPNSSVCMTAAGSTRINNDIDYTRLLDTRDTLDIDFTDTNLSDDEQDVLALSRNLFSHDLLDYKVDNVMARADNFDVISSMRSLHAIRGVAHNSMAEIVGMKASGSGTVRPSMGRVLEELGLPAGDVNGILGAKPSYYAQMDVLTRRMYHNPTFYTNLHTKPENVKRTGVAIQALQIMHDRDRFEASLRREMLISLILEMKLREAQSVTENLISGQKRSLINDAR